jgi:hypothetical protein
VHLDAVNRLGRSLVCEIAIAPLGQSPEGVILAMDVRVEH